MSRFCDYYNRRCDSASNAGWRGNQRRGAMRITLRRAVQTSVFLACLFFLNFIYFDSYFPKWRQSYENENWLDDDNFRGPNNIDKRVLVDYDILVPRRDLLRKNVVIIAGRLLSEVGVANVEDSLVGDDQGRVKNFWRSNQPVDSGDTRSLLDLQTRRKRRSAKVIYVESPLVAILSGHHPEQKQQRELKYVRNPKILKTIKYSRNEKTDTIENRGILMSRIHPSQVKNGEKLRQPPNLRQVLKRIPPLNPIASQTLSPPPSSILSVIQSIPAIRPTILNDIFISVKTTEKFHEKRLKLVLDTWFQYAKDQTFFFTDTNDEELNKRTNGHMINTNCSAVHNRQALCCKMAQEYDTFLESKKRWFCHVDDDTYVNVPKLVTLLQKYNHTQDWYLGKLSLKHPIEIMDREVPGKKISIWFATGGAGFCISRSLALKMMPHAGGGRLMTVGEQIRLPDDCTVGYIIGHLLNKPLTEVESFHSHLEALWLLRPSDLEKHVTFSYSKYGEKMNIVNVPGFTNKEDPTRLWSVHCYLFPYLKKCRTLH